MFSSGGYFRSVNCPFFVHGLCHRPYCHFRHSKPGYGSTSKNAVVKSCLKTKTTAYTTTSSSEGTSSSQSLQTSNNKVPLSTKLSLGSKADVQAQDISTKDNTSSVATIRDGTDQQKTEVSDSKEEKKEKGETQTSKKAPSILDSLDKLEQALDEASASLLVCNNIKNANLSSKTHSSLSNTLPAVNTSKTEPKLQDDFNLDKATQNKEQEILKYTKNKDQCQDIMNNTGPTKCSEPDEKSHSDKISSSKEVLNSVNELKTCNETVTAKDTSGDLPAARIEGKPKEAPSIKIPKDQKTEPMNKKKRKSSDIADVAVKKAKLKKQNSQEESVRLDSKDSSTNSKEKKKLEKNKTPSERKDKTDCDLHNSSLKRPLQKPKQELKSIDIDFFGSPKKMKSNKTEMKEKTKSKKEQWKEEPKVQKTESQLKILQKNSVSKIFAKEKSKQTDMKETKNSKKLKAHDSVQKGSSVSMVTSLFESDDDVRFSSDSLSDSDSETDAVDSSNEMLREIFDNYDPQKDIPVTLSSAKRAKESGSRASTSTSPVKDNTQPRAVDLQGFGKKPRVAHSASYLVQRKSSNLNPVRRVPKTIASSSSVSSTQEKSSSKEYSLIQAKKRVAHQPKPANQSSLPRPRVPIEYGAKVPQSFRQRYLDKIIDEHLRLCASEKEAFEKAVEEERSLYERSARRQMYLNLCINAIKNLRCLPTPEHELESTPSEVNTSTDAVAEGGSTSAGTKSPKKFDTKNLTEEMFYDLLSPYILSEEELVENGYPRASPTTPGKVTFKSRKTQSPSKDPNRRTCCRCGTPYSIREDGTYIRPEECVYHIGRLLRRRTAGEVTTTYSCCGGDGSTPGCAVGKVHVSEGKNATEGFMTTIVSPLAGNQKKIFAIDCEMCYTIVGLELTRATVVDWKLGKIYDTFVKPDNPVLDYNTKFSGVTEECLRGVKTSIREVQAVLLSMIHRDSILVGHSLESDLLALKLVHSKVVDTSVVFPHRLGPPYKRALRTLTAEFLKQIIQDDEAGHDSLEDAKASLELMLYKAKEDLKKKERKKAPKMI